MQWFRTAKNQDVSTGPLACPFARSLAPLTHSLALHCLLCMRPLIHSFICFLAHALSPQLWGKMSQNDLVLSHSGYAT